MQVRTFHGNIDPQSLADALIAEFNHGNYVAQQIGTDDSLMVQVATRRDVRSGGKMGMTIGIQRVPSGVCVTVNEGQWFGVAASLGQTAFGALANPWSLLGRLDDLAQDVSSLQLPDRVWKTIEAYSRSVGARSAITGRLETLMCEYCSTANPVAESHCVACGAPLGRAQPVACLRCGFVMPPRSGKCANCGATMPG